LRRIGCIIFGLLLVLPVQAAHAAQAAAYTSWALWHWVNEEIADKLLDNTMEFCNNDYLMFCLSSEDLRFVKFGLNQVLQKIPADHQVF
jgi:hypothetical protein